MNGPKIPGQVTAATPIFYSAGETTLANTLAARWAGRRFDKVHVLTGSTDESGAFLRWAYLDSVNQDGRLTDNHLGRLSGMIVADLQVMVVAP